MSDPTLGATCAHANRAELAGAGHVPHLYLKFDRRGLAEASKHPIAAGLRAVVKTRPPEVLIHLRQQGITRGGAVAGTYS
jgi:hypothetical protein